MLDPYNVHGRFILDENGEPVPEPDLMRWAQWFEGEFRRLARTEISPQLFVSTVFLGLDHNFGQTGPPILWETMVFRNRGNGREEQDTWRYSSRAAALAGHAAAVKHWRRRWGWRWILDPWEWLTLRWMRVYWHSRRKLKALWQARRRHVLIL